MALQRNFLAKELYERLLAAEREDFGDEIANDPQKKAMRWSYAKVTADWLVWVLTTQAEIDLDRFGPNHAIPAGTTGVSGTPAHVHPMNQGPITHKKGKFIV